MEQPQTPQQPENMFISPQEFKEQAKQGSLSYLSLLPAEVTQMVGQYAYQGLENGITEIRQNYLANLATRDRFFNDEVFNRKIINDLMKRFGIPFILPWYFYIGLMLNTPASIRFAFAVRENFFIRNPEVLHETFEQLFNIFKDYLLHASLSYKEVIAYVRDYIKNIHLIITERFKSEYYDRLAYDIDSEKEIKQFVEAAILKIGQKYKKELQSSYSVPEIKIALDLGSWHARNWLTDVFDGNVKISASSLVICNQSASLLETALEKNDYNQIVFILKSILLSKNIEQLLQLCLKQKIEGKLGELLIAYVLHHEERELEKLSLSVPFSRVLVEEAIKKHYTNNQLLKLLEKLRINLEFARITPIGWGQSLQEFMVSGERASIGLPDVRAGRAQAIQRAEKIRAIGIDLLITAIKASQETLPVVKKLLELGADINGVDKEGVTILMYAIKNAHFNIVSFLLDQPSININACDNNGHNALSFVELLPESPERDVLVKRLKDMGAEQEGTCAIQ